MKPKVHMGANTNIYMIFRLQLCHKLKTFLVKEQVSYDELQDSQPYIPHFSARFVCSLSAPAVTLPAVRFPGLV